MLRRTEAHDPVAEPPLNDALQTDKSAATNKENASRVDANVLLLWMLAPALRRHIANRAFQDLQQSLLHSFAGNIAGDGNVFRFAGYFVDLINVNDAALRPFD